MAARSKSQEALGIRLADMLSRLNNGETLDITTLPDDYGISLRTAQRDISRLLPLLSTTGKRYYRLDQNKHGYLSQDEIQRFCRFASISELFPEADRRFFHEKLTQSITVKGFQYEDISSKRQEFDLITQAIAERRLILFDYTKVSGSDSKSYTIAPYRLVNKNGIWYLIGLDNGKQKTYCFTQVQNLHIQPETFEPDETLLQQITETDSIYHGNHISEIIVKVSPAAAGYFTRRALLPNQETVRRLEDGTLLLASKNINPQEILPIVQYWIPHLSIVSPAELQEKLKQQLAGYLEE
ncbi:helix-turn-helix transcriptional regulator [Neisseria animalis]|uniref:WYL domain-containing protein n=1 Tax=Neisseria animalis TaxID=492 RepID=A0A5P3MSL8_NEIAN|nr:WYL domain-containing protein [Neisseria animalis]QEY24603.1 WYL domain-containing protein [Neisseria animalis]ROW32984.1 WYL domain-containing protein [Neisseria animalis]VEE07459.1 Uncharacterised protein [Neisseria animalis]